VRRSIWATMGHLVRCVRHPMPTRAGPQGGPKVVGGGPRPAGRPRGGRSAGLPGAGDAGGGAPKEPSSRVVLRLAIGRDGIGLELADPVDAGCVRVAELAAALPGMRFPVDVSGGVARFRHRRGDLRVLRLEIAARAVEKWAAPRLRGLVGTRTPDV